MSESYGIFSRLIKTPGVPEKFQHAGKYVHVLKADGATDVSIQTDTGDKIVLPPGHGLPVTFNYLMVDVPNAGGQINVKLYIGSVPLTKPTIVQDDTTMTTSDVVTVPSKGGLPVKLFFIPGTLALNGVNWRRREIRLANTDAAIDVWVRASNTAFNSQQANADGIQLPHGDATHDGTPETLRTDDQISISNYDAGNAVQVRVMQTWVRDY